MQKFLSSAKEIAQIAVMTALLIGGQFALSAVGGVEIVTILLLSYCYVFGWKRGVVVAIAFVLLRNLVFGLSVPDLILYAVYYPTFAIFWGTAGKKIKNLAILCAVACLFTICFTGIDNIIKPIFNFFSPYVKWNWRATELYWIASLPFMAVQTLCTLFSVLFLFNPLKKVFSAIYGNHKNEKIINR